MTREFVVSRLRDAVEHLASSPDSLQDRVAYAYRGILIRLMPSDLPEGMRETFEEIEQTLSAVEPDRADLTAAEASARALSDKEARALARSIFDLYQRAQALPEEPEGADTGDPAGDGGADLHEGAELHDHEGHDHDGHDHDGHDGHDRGARG